MPLKARVSKPPLQANVEESTEETSVGKPCPAPDSALVLSRPTPLQERSSLSGLSGLFPSLFYRRDYGTSLNANSPQLGLAF